jgi:manganese/zinc/iron transport system permease protein
MKEFRLVCFDRDFAAATGWPVSSIDLGMMALVTLVTVIGLQAVGILLIVALLVIPPAAARFWTNRTTVMVPLAGVIGGLSGYFGSVASALLPGIPVGSVIVLVASSFFLVSLIIAPARGLLGTATTQLWMRVRIAEDHLLRSLYEQAEPFSDKGTVPPPVTIANLTFTKQWHNSTRLLLLYWCHYRGWIDIAKKRARFGIELTPRGSEHASRLVRNHRLWEEYIATYADVSLSHVDYSADLVEHSLSPAIISLLEESLAARKGPEWLLRKQRSLHPIREELG